MCSEDACWVYSTLSHIAAQTDDNDHQYIWMANDEWIFNELMTQARLISLNTVIQLHLHTGHYLPMLQRGLTASYDLIGSLDFLNNILKLSLN